jgi:hypothetical protein
MGREIPLIYLIVGHGVLGSGWDLQVPHFLPETMVFRRVFVVFSSMFCDFFPLEPG